MQTIAIYYMVNVVNQILRSDWLPERQDEAQEYPLSSPGLLARRKCRKIGPVLF